MVSGFYDIRRYKEIPAAIQTHHMKKSIEGIKNQFGVTPLWIRTGRHDIILSYKNNTVRLAAIEDFGFCRGYSGKDYVITNIQDMGNPDAPLVIDAPPDGHDKGIVEHPTAFNRGLDSLGDLNYIGFNEYIGYLHTEIKVRSGKTLKLNFYYNDHYCQHFQDNPSTWELHLSDRLIKKMIDKGKLDVVVDGKITKQGVVPSEYLNEKIIIELPKGTGTHTYLYRWK